MAKGMKKAEQFHMALKLRASVKEHLYCNSPLRNAFQVRPVEEGEIIMFEGVKYARIFNEDYTVSDEFKNKTVYVPFFEICCLSQENSFHQDAFNKLICDDMLVQEEQVFKSLKKYLTKTRKGVLLIRTDVQVVCANDSSGIIGFSTFEHIGAAILNK